MKGFGHQRQVLVFILVSCSPRHDRGFAAQFAAN